MIDISLIFLSFLTGGFQGEVKFQLTYSSGGAIDASTALREVNSICESSLMSNGTLHKLLYYFLYSSSTKPSSATVNDHRLFSTPSRLTFLLYYFSSYSMAAENLYEPPPPSYQAAQSSKNHFAGEIKN